MPPEVIYVAGFERNLIKVQVFFDEALQNKNKQQNNFYTKVISPIFDKLDTNKDGVIDAGDASFILIYAAQLGAGGN